MAQDVGLPVGTRQRMTRLSLGTLVARKVDRLITRVQEWLEGPDLVGELMVAYAIIGAAVVVMAAAVVGRLL